MKFFFTGKPRREVDEEIAFHLERQVEANIVAGMPAAEARRQAMIAFGSRERAREECREERPLAGRWNRCGAMCGTGFGGSDAIQDLRRWRC